MKNLIIVLIAFGNAYAIADSKNLCTCYAFPGNYPGAGLYFYPNPPQGESDAYRLRMFESKTPTNPTDIADLMRDCYRAADELEKLAICKKKESAQ